MSDKQPSSGGPDVPATALLEVPREIAVCPECGGSLCCEPDGEKSFFVYCDGEESIGDRETHRGWQSDWQPIVDKVTAWASRTSNTAGLLRQADKGRTT